MLSIIKKSYLFVLFILLLHASAAWATPAEEQLTDAAVKGSIEAMRSLAELYADKNSAIFSTKKAQNWYQKAADLGDGRAQRGLGALYEIAPGSQPDYQLAAFWYQKAAEQGIARAQTNLGNLYESGRGVPLDPTEAARWYTAAAEQGYARGQVYLGQLYQKGEGVPQSHEKALDWFHKAALQGYSRGYMKLGKAYQEGLGVKQDIEQARQWYKKAADRGFPPAVLALQSLTEKALSPLETLANEADTKPSPDTTNHNRPPTITVAATDVAAAYNIADNELRWLDRQIANTVYDEGSFIASVMQEECSDYNPDYLQREVLAAEADLEEHDLGLKFESAYGFHGGDTTTERQNAYVGLSWDLLNEGLFENKSQSRRKRYEEQMEEIQAEKDRLTSLFSCRDTLLIHSFNRFKKNILEQRQNVLDELYQLSRQAYFSGYLLADDLLKIELQVARTKAKINTYNRLEGQIIAERQIIDRLPPPNLVGINLGAVLQAIRHDPGYKEVADLAEKILTEKARSLYDKRLRLYARTGINEDKGDISSGDVSAGIYFSMPLLRRTATPLPAQVKKMKSTLAQEQEVRLRDAARLYNGYNEKLTDATTMVYRMQIVAERLRRSRLQSEDFFQSEGTYGFKEHLLVLTHLQELLDARMEFIAVEESLYRQLLHLFTKLSIGYQEEFTSPIKVDLPIHRGRLGNRAVYLWGQSFAENDIEYLLHLLRAKGIQTAILSASSKTDLKKRTEFLKRAELENLDVELMVSENSWVFPEKWQSVQKRIEALAALGQPIHLDIEPHTLKGYKENKQLYDGYFIELITKIHAICTSHTVQLHISLPVTASKSVIEAAADHCQKIYVMAYGAMSVDHLLEKLQPFSAVSRDRLVLAQRPRDFHTELQLEQRIDDVIASGRFSSFAFHNLQQLMTLFR